MISKGRASFKFYSFLFLLASSLFLPIFYFYAKIEEKMKSLDTFFSPKAFYNEVKEEKKKEKGKFL